MISKEQKYKRKKEEKLIWVDVVLFYRTINKQNKTVPQLARNLGIGVSTLYRKINSETCFQLDEIRLLKQELELTEEEAYRIFIAGYLQQGA